MLVLRTTIKFDRANHIYIVTLGEVSTYIEQSIPNPHAGYQIISLRLCLRTEVGIRKTASSMTSGSSADTAWTFSGEVAAPAAGESTADDTVVQSVDSSTEDDKEKASSSATKVAPRAKSASRASTPSRPTSTGSRTARASDRRPEKSKLPVMQTIGITAEAKDKEAKSPAQISKPSSSRSSSIRSRNSAKVRGRNVRVVGRTLPPFGRRQPLMDAEMNLEQVAVEALPAIEDSSPVSHRSSIGEDEGQALTALKQQLESV